jgi:hypothetical protein
MLVSFSLRGKVCGKLKFEAILGKLSLDVEALTYENLKKKFKKKVKTDLPYLSFYKKKPETHIFFFWPCLTPDNFTRQWGNMHVTVSS